MSFNRKTQSHPEKKIPLKNVHMVKKNTNAGNARVKVFVSMIKKKGFVKNAKDLAYVHTENENQNARLAEDIPYATTKELSLSA